jgi:hypothetical protein
VRPLTQKGGERPMARGEKCVYNASPSARRVSDVLVAIRRGREDALTAPLPDEQILLFGTGGRRGAEGRHEHVPHEAS